MLSNACFCPSTALIFGPFFILASDASIPSFLFISKFPCLHVCLAEINNGLCVVYVECLWRLYLVENKTLSVHDQDYCHLHGDCLLHLSFLLSFPCFWFYAFVILSFLNLAATLSVAIKSGFQIAEGVINKINYSLCIDHFSSVHPWFVTSLSSHIAPPHPLARISTSQGTHRQEKL